MCLIQRKTIDHCLMHKNDVVVDMENGKVKLVNGSGSYDVCNTKYQDINLGGRKVLVHVLFAIFRWGYKCEGYQVNHINSDPSDNRISNLELVTPKENTKHAFFNGRKANKYGRGGRVVYEIDKGGNMLNKYKSTAEAARATGCLQELVSRVCREERKTTNGKRFVFADE